MPGRPFSTVLSLTILCTLFLAPTVLAQSISYPYVADEVILRFRPQASEQDKAAILQALGATERQSFDFIGAKLHGISNVTVLEAVYTWSGHPLIEYIEPNYILTVNETPNDPRFNELWGMENTGQTGGNVDSDIDATNAWDVFTGSHSVVIGVIDTGVDHTHPDLAANIYVNPGEIPNNGIDDDNNGFVDDVRGWDFVNNDNDPFDDYGHGTHVAGTIGAVGNNGIGVAGVNWNVQIMPIKFLDSFGGGSTANAILSVQYATMMNVHLTNNSWGGGGFSQALRDAIEEAGNHDILFVAAAGNSGLNTDVNPAYPASYDLDNIVSVAATDHNDLRAGFSNYGVLSVDLAAPGVNILSTIPGGGYASNQGTSMASPHVAGAAGLIFGRLPGISALAVKALLLNFVDPVPALSGVVLTGGRLNAFFPIADPDEVPPARIDDLEILAVDGAWIDIGWSATGDDSLTGDASSYDVRFATFAIDENNFDSATPASGEPDPGPPGTAESMRIAGLDFGTTFYIAIKARDEFGNGSTISNVVSATTLGPPSISSTPDFLSADLLTGAMETQILTLMNSGQSELNFDISIPAAQTGVIAKSRLVDNTRLTPPSSEVLEAALGTRATQAYAFGQEPMRTTKVLPPSLQAPRISSGELSIGILNSGGSPTEIQSLLLGFPDIGVVDIIDAGALPPTLETLGAYEVVIVVANSAFPDPVATGDVLADYADAGGGVIVTLAAFIPGFGLQGRFLSEGYMPFDGGVGPIGSSTLGNFDVSHPIMAGVAQATGALLGATQLANGAEFVADWAFGEPFVATKSTNLVAVNIFVALTGNWSGDIPLILHNAALWCSQAVFPLSAEPSSGVVPAGNNLQVEITFDATGLVGGNYQTEVIIINNDPNDPQHIVPASLHVTGAPDILLSATSIDFGDVFVGGSLTDTLLVSNPGTDLLDISSVVASPADYSLDTGPFTLAVGAERRVVVTFSPSTATSMPGTVTFMSNDPDENVVVVSLSGTGIEPPIIDVMPDSLSEDLLTGGTATHTLTISNSGPSPLEFTATSTLLGLAQSNQSGLGSFDLDAKLEQYAVFSSGAFVGQAPALAPARKSVRQNQRSPFEALLNSDTVLFYDDMESGTNGWSHYPTFGSALDQWNQTTARSSSGATSWNVSQHAASGSEALQTPPIDLLSYDDASLSFKHWYDFDDCSDPEFDSDGGIVEISINGGASWQQIFPIDGYPRILDDICGNPLAYLDAYTQTSGTGADFVTEVFDLTPFAGNVVTIRFHAGWDCGNCDTNEGWYIDDVGVYSQGVSWLDLSPESGIVASGSSIDIEVTFDASGLLGGAYDADIRIDNNDPLRSTVVVPAHLQVTGAPDIAVSPNSLDYGEVFLGVAKVDTIVVSNVGTDLLTVESLVDDSVYELQPPNFDLHPGESINVYVTFSPVVTGGFPATVSINSDDPDEPLIEIPVTGTGVEPPVIAVSPDSLVEDLFTGDLSTQTLSIHNSGGSDLTFELDVAPLNFNSMTTAGEGGPGSASRFKVTTRRRPASIAALEEEVKRRGPGPLAPHEHGDPPAFDPGTHDPNEFPEAILADDFEDGDLNGWTIAPGGNKEVTNATAADGTFFSYHESNAPISHFNGIYQITGQVQPAYIGFWVRSSSTNDHDGYFVVHSSGQGEAIWFYMQGTGHLYVNGDVGGNQTVPYVANTWYHIEFRDIDWNTKTFAYYVDDVLVQEGISFRNAGFINDFSRFDLYSFSIGSEAWWDEIIVSDEQPAGWLSAEPLTGTVSPGETLEIDVTFDATGLFGGEYRSNLVVHNNDPVHPEIIVPAILQVTGAPNIVLSDSLLGFGDLFVGTSRSDTLIVSNTGTDLLVATFTPDDPSYSVAPTNVLLQPGESAPVVVTFAPGSAGNFPALLTIASNDPGEPMIELPMTGTAVEPPVIVVSPDSLVEHLLTGDTSTQTVSIHNSGGSDLTFQLRTELVSVVNKGSKTTSVAARGETRWSRPRRMPAVAHLEERQKRPAQQPLPPYLRGDLPIFDPGDNDPGDNGPGELQQAILADDFEDGDFDGWVNAGSGIKGVTSGTAAGGSIFSYHESNAPGSHYNGIYQTTAAAQPAYVGFWVRSSSTSNHDGYFVVRSAAQAEAIFFLMQGTGFLYVNGNVGGDESVPYVANKWYHIEFQDIDWDTKTFSYYVNDVLVKEGISFRSAAFVEDISRVDLYSFSNGSEAWWDEIYIANEPPARWLIPEPLAGTVPPGQTLEIDVTFDATGLLGGEYHANLVINNNDPLQSQITVPATLHVTGAPNIGVPDSLLGFGDLFVGASRSDTMTVANLGTDLLVATFTPDDPNYSVDPTNVLLQPGESAPIIVTFAPGSVGSFPALLTIASNDPSEPLIEIPMTGAGVEPPVLEIDPAGFFAHLNTGETETQVLHLSNIGGSDLDFDIHVGVGALSVALQESVDYAKGEEDPRIGEPVTLGQGGPDMFGYHWIDSDETGGPTFNWFEIAGLGTLVHVSGDDAISDPIPIGFSFPFYGNHFTELRVCTNGFISFSDTFASFTNQPLPSLGAPPNLLAAFWDDLAFPSLNAWIHHDGSRVIIEYLNVPQLGGGAQYTFQIILYPTGKIVYQYLTMGDPTTSATVGIQNETRNDGLQVVFNNAYIHDGLAIEFSPSPMWLSVEPSSGIVPAGGNLPVDVHFDASGLVGLYSAMIHVQTNDPLHENSSVQAWMNVTGVPIIAVDPTSLDFGQVFVGHSSTLQLEVANTGTDTLAVTGITVDDPDYQVAPQTFTVQPGTSQIIDVSITANSAGAHPAALSIAHNAAGSPTAIALNAQALIPPQVSLDPTSMEAAALQGGSKTKILRVHNTGGSNLVFSAMAGNLPNADVQQHSFVELSKNELDPRPGLLGTGDPDGFGYHWVDSEDASGPVFEWNDISQTGTAIALLGDDRLSSAISIGFDFPFYGESFHSLRVSTNGFVSLGPAGDAFANQPLANPGAPGNLLAAFWDDLEVDFAGGSRVYTQADEEKFVVQFTNLRRLASAGLDYTFQIILFADGSLVYQYLSLGSEVSSATVGIQDATGSNGLNIVFNEEYLHEELAIRISLPPGWLSVTPTAGVVAAGEFATLQVTLDAQSLPEGDSFGRILVVSNDPDDSVVASDATLHVGTIDAAETVIDPQVIDPKFDDPWVGVRVVLPAGYQAQDVVLSTVRLQGHLPVDPNTVVLDVTQPDAQSLKFKFERSGVVKLLPETADVELVITGEIRDKTYFEGRDTVEVIHPLVQSPNGGEVLGAGSQILVSWNIPNGWPVTHTDVFYTEDDSQWGWKLVAEGVEGQSVPWTVPDTESSTLKLRIFVYGEEGLLGRDTSDGSFTVGDQPTDARDALPSVHALLANVPNPFNPVTSIGYELPTPSSVKLHIYDVSGRLVRTLVNKQMPAGRHQVIWDGRTNNGTRTASGVYFYRIRAEGFSATRRMVLLK